MKELRKYNELEAFLYMSKHLIESAKKTGKKGMVLNKGSGIETKLSYDAALDVCEGLRAQFSMDGCFTLGTCMTCSKWCAPASVRKDFGRCDKTGGCTYKYHTCLGWGRPKDEV